MTVRHVLGGVMVLVAATACGGAGSTGVPQPPASSASSAPLPAGVHPATRAAIHGFWKPTGPRGQQSAAYVLFSSNDVIWSGSDGCNAFNGRYSLGSGGRLKASSGPTTLMGCENWQGPSWVGRASRVAIDGDTLILFDETGKKLGEMVRLAE